MCLSLYLKAPGSERKAKKNSTGNLIYYTFEACINESMKNSIRFAVFVSIIACLGSCKPELPSWDNESVFPLVNAKLFMSNFAGDTLLTTDQDDLLSLFYEYTLTDFQFDSLISGLDTIAGQTYVSPFTITLTPGSQIITTNEINRLTVNDIYLKILKISHGVLILKTSNKYMQPIRIEYSIPEAMINGNPLTIQRDIPAATSTTQPFLYEEHISIDNLRWLFFSTGGDVYNCFHSVFKVWISPNATEPVQVNHNDQFQFFIGMNDFDISYARGYFGQHDYDFSGESQIDMFKLITADEFSIEDVSLNLEVTNHTGMDIRLLLQELKGINLHNNQNVSYSGPLLHTYFNIIRATEQGVEQGIVPPNTTIYDLSQNSNLKQFIENMPGKLFVDASLSMNPLGNISGGNDFYYGIPPEAKLVFSMPLHFSAQNLKLSDTLIFSSDFLKKPIQALTIKSIIQNCFPFTFDLNMSFLDSNRTHLFSLPFDKPVKEAEMGISGRTLGPEQTVIHLSIPHEKLDAIRKSTFITLDFAVSSMPYGQHVKVFSDYFIDIRTIAQINLLIEQKE